MNDNYAVDMCGVERKRWTTDLNVTGLRPALATIHVRCELLDRGPNKLNLFSWLLSYLCGKKVHCTKYLKKNTFNVLSI